MPRTKGSKNKSTGRRFKPYEGRFPDDRHVRLTKDMMLDPAYLKLSANAKTLYQYMKLWAAGQETVTYAASMAKEVMSKPTFLKARDELLTRGFIVFVNKAGAKNKKETAVYEFSSSWRGKSGAPVLLDLKDTG